jgi:hypothetical protein
MIGATQQCGECHSPLRPCKCDRKKKPKKRLKTRNYKTVHASNPLVYGDVYDEIAELARGGACILKGHMDTETGKEHVCGDLWRATAHHEPHVGSGGDDRRCGPVCGLADDYVHGRRWGWSKGVIEERFGVNVNVACKIWGDTMIASIFGDNPPVWLKEVEL